MNAGELKVIVAELKRDFELAEAPQISIILTERLTEILSVLDDQLFFLPAMIEPVKEVIKSFWSWVIHNLPLNKWQNDITVNPWLNFQRLMVKANLLERDFHHSILYQELKNCYDAVIPNNQLGITMLLSLLMRTGRMLGYAERGEIDRYPLIQLKALLETKRPQEAEKIKDIIFLLRSTFYLIYKHCTVEQLNILPALIFFRHRTTDEERRTELAIFHWLSTNASQCLEFFRSNNGFIDTRTFKSVDSLQAVAHLLPAGRNDFLKETDENRWIYKFIQKSRVNRSGSRDDLLNETLHLLKLDFATKRDKSYSAVLSFVAEIKNQMQTLTRSETKLVHSAINLFALDEYINLRTEDTRNKHSLLSFSKATKCHAAEKRKLAIYGRPVKLSFFEVLATNQGRLKRLIAPIEPFEQEALALSIN